MKFNEIRILETDTNLKGDLFARLMGDFFHVLGYNDPRYNIHKSGREVDIQAFHRIENKIAIAECKADKQKIGGDAINKFAGVLEVEKRRFRKQGNDKHEIVGYFISLYGYKETAIEQENELDNDRIFLISPEKIAQELIKGKILVTPEKAVDKSARSLSLGNLKLIPKYDLIGHENGWVWCIYYGIGAVQAFSLIHAEGELLVEEIAEKIIHKDKEVGGILHQLTYLRPKSNSIEQNELIKAKNKYFKYLENECGEIQFEGLPTDKDAGSIRVELETIFIPLKLTKKDNENLESEKNKTEGPESIGALFSKNEKLAILAKPGGGKSTLIKRLAVAYAFTERLALVDDNLPKLDLFPIFIRCREIGNLISASISDIIMNIPKRAEIASDSNLFENIVSTALQQGRALLLVDGLDEISEDRDRISFVNQLRTFIATYPNIKVIVTSREAGFRVVGGSLAGYCVHYTIASLDENDIRMLTLKWHKAILDDSQSTIKEASNIAEIIISDERIKVLAENPLLLTTLLFVKRWAGYLPTKKSILYQEMIKLLLVTWNVEGHEQLDLDEAEPQLSFVAYAMSQNGLQSISENDLKQILINARKQMPEVLGYAKVSVSEFIKRVESRSSLLIMTGHTVKDGILTPIYEFLHLSFQEFLTARAIVEKYYPDANAADTINSVITPYLDNQSWREIIPLVAALAKRETKQLIELLIEKIEEATKTARIVKHKQAILAELLGQCIANEIQITPELLRKALSTYVSTFKDEITIGSSAALIGTSKFSLEYKKALENRFTTRFKGEQDIAVLSAYSDLLKVDYKKDYVSILSNIATQLEVSKDKIKNIEAILSLMMFAYTNHRVNSTQKLESTEQIKLDEILDKFLYLMDKKDKWYNVSILWAIAWVAQCFGISQQLMEKVIDTALRHWLYSKSSSIVRMAAWILTETVNESTSFDWHKYEDINNIVEKKMISKTYINPTAALFVGYHIGIVSREVFQQKFSPDSTINGNKLLEGWKEILSTAQ